MFANPRRIGLALVVGLAALWALSPAAHGQVRFARPPRLPQFQGPANAGDPIVGISVHKRRRKERPTPHA